MKFEVVKPWYGVQAGEIIEADEAKVHPSLRPNLRELPDSAELTPSVRKPKAEDKPK